jgi:hypothetical protein
MFSSIFASLWPHLLRIGSRITCITRNKRISCSINFKRPLNTAARYLQGSSEFHHSKSGSFYQDAPSLENQFLGDVFLTTSLKRILPSKVGMHLSGLGGGGRGAPLTGKFGNCMPEIWNI